LSQLLSKVMSHPAGITSDVQCVLLAAGRRTQAGDATDQWRINENQLIFDEVKAYKNYAKFLVHHDVIPAGCDSYFRQ